MIFVYFANTTFEWLITLPYCLVNIFKIQTQGIHTRFTLKKVLEWSHCTNSKVSLYVRLARYNNQTAAETPPKDVSEAASLLSFAKPPPILEYLPSNESLNTIMHPPAKGSELSPKL